MYYNKHWIDLSVQVIYKIVLRITYSAMDMCLEYTIVI